METPPLAAVLTVAWFKEVAANAPADATNVTGIEASGQLRLSDKTPEIEALWFTKRFAWSPGFRALIPPPTKCDGGRTKPMAGGINEAPEPGSATDKVIVDQGGAVCIVPPGAVVPYKLFRWSKMICVEVAWMV